VTLDFETRERDLRLAYLFRGEYHDKSGKLRVVHWCGPKSRTGSGLTLDVPSGARGGLSADPTGDAVVWESRMNGCTLDAKLGNITQVIQAITDLNFNVDISGGPRGESLSEGDLEYDVVWGRWRNNKASLWLIDLDTWESEQFVWGTFDRNPTSITSGVFQVTVGVSPIIPDRKFPSTRIPVESQIGDMWTVTSASGGGSNQSYYVPASYLLNPDHEGKFLGCTFGSSQHAISGTLDDGFIWKELVPYGTRGGAALSQYAYCHVDPHPGCYVHEAWLELWRNDADGNPIVQPIKFGDNTNLGSSSGVQTFENTDPRMGPVGTNCRLPNITPFASGGLTGTFAFYDKWRVVARVSGPGSGIYTPGIGEDPAGTSIKLYNPYSGAQNVRPNPWDILEDLFDDHYYLGGLTRPVWATNSISEFESNQPNPHAFMPYAYFNMACSVPSYPNVVEKMPSVREALQGLASSFPFDIVHRWDPISEELRMAPVWRPRINAEPDYEFDAYQLARTDPPELAQYDNAHGKYANLVYTRTPKFLTSPTFLPITATPSTATQDNNIANISNVNSVMSDSIEQAVDKENAVVEGKRTWRHWLHSGVRGNAQAGWVLGIELSQPQRSIRAMHGVRSYRVGMGSTIRYNIRGVNSDTGQVRGMRYNFDAQTVSIESLHIDHYHRGVPPDHIDESMKDFKDQASEDSGKD